MTFQGVFRLRTNLIRCILRINNKRHLNLKFPLHPHILKQIVALFISVFSFLFVHHTALATHLIGGNIGYEYVGPTPGNPNQSRFQITLEAYMDCNSVNWSSPTNPTGFPEQSVTVGVYEGALNPTNAISHIPTFNQTGLFLVDSNFVDPNLPQICDPFNLLSNVCVYLVTYQGTVDVDNSADGYWIVYDRCCRPSGIVNLSGSGAQSFVYSTWIPAQNGTIVQNSNAVFSDTLLSYICRTDTAYISNIATDPDGDSLVYSLETPYNGITGNGNAGSNPPVMNYLNAPMNPYTIPPPTALYQTGYNLNDLLGATGYSAVDPNSGLTTFLTNQIGSFVAAVEIKEYRNGNIVGVTRRNMLLISDNCPNNNAPNQNTTVLDPSAVGPLNYVVEAGDTVCFDLNYEDLDNDPVSFEATSNIFDPAITNPAATVISPVQGIGSVSSTICWNTGCHQGRDSAYTVDVMVVDSACPPLQLPQTVYIKVNPYVGPENIFGDSIFCITGDTVTYTADTIAGVTYTWSVIGGTIVSANGSPSVDVIWNAALPTGTIELNTVNTLGCISDPLTRTITLSNVITEAGTPQSFCPGSQVTLGGNPTTSDPNNSILWSPSTGLNDPTLANPIASPTITTTYTVEVTNSLGCVGYDTVTVSVFSPIPSGIQNNYFLCPGGDFQVNINGSQFLWQPTTGLSNSTIGNPVVSPAASTIYTVTYTDINGCNNADTMNVDVNSVVPTDAGPDLSVCFGDSVTLGGTPTSPPFTSFLWSPNTGMNNDTLANPTVLTSNSTTYIVQTSNDTCTGVDTVVVNVVSAPPLTLSNDTTACSYDSVMLIATGNGTFLWNNGASLSDSTIATPFANPDSTTTYTVTLTDVNGCTNEDSMTLSVQQPPLTSAGGQFNACKNTPVSIGGNPTGPVGTTFSWGPVTGLDNANAANPSATVSADITYIVTVTDNLGCMSTDSAEVLVFSISQLSDTVLCTNIAFQPQVNVNNGVGPFSFLWSNGSSLSDSTILNPTIYTGQFDQYLFFAADSNGCTDTLGFNISAALSSSAAFDYTVLPSCTDAFVSVTNNSNNAVAYEWYVNGELQSTSASPDLSFSYGNNSEILLITESLDGCFDTLTTTVQAQSFEDLALIEASNVFTPNGDGVNDFFELKTNGDFGDCVELSIFNRNGVLVHQSTGGVHTWNGRSSTGQKYSDGVYYYIYKINNKEYTGHVTIMK